MSRTLATHSPSCFPNYRSRAPSTPSRTWFVQDAGRSPSRQPSSHSFHDPGQFFRAPSAASPTSPTSLTARPPPLHPHFHQHLNRIPTSPFSPRESHSSNSVSPILPTLYGQQTTVPQTPMSDQGLAAAVYPLHLTNLSGLTSSDPPTARDCRLIIPPISIGYRPPTIRFAGSSPVIFPARPSATRRPGTAPATYYPSPTIRQHQWRIWNGTFLGIQLLRTLRVGPLIVRTWHHPRCC